MSIMTDARCIFVFSLDALHLSLVSFWSAMNIWCMLFDHCYEPFVLYAPDLNDFYDYNQSICERYLLSLFTVANYWDIIFLSCTSLLK